MSRRKLRVLRQVVIATLEDSFFETRRLRHDGWDGPAMAILRTQSGGRLTSKF